VAHFDVVLDLGWDHGADGGEGWDTHVTVFPSGRTRRNQRRADAVGVWQLGGRRLNVSEYTYLKGFFHAMRGQAHSFLYKDMNDHRAEQEPLVADGSAEVELIKTYGLAINPWTRRIRKPQADSVLIELDDGGGFEPLVGDVDYELDPSTGSITWLITPPDAPQLVRWTGEFYVPARFDRDTLDAQFIAIDGEDALYELGALGVVEELDP
jgi:uncharacterized protein (TIGR02217 family)